MELLLEGRDGRKYPEVSGNQEEEKKKRKTDFFSNFSTSKANGMVGWIVAVLFNKQAFVAARDR